MARKKKETAKEEKSIFAKILDVKPFIVVRAGHIKGEFETMEEAEKYAEEIHGLARKR